MRGPGIVVEGTAAVLSRASHDQLLSVNAVARTDLPDLSGAPAEADAGDAEAEGPPAPQELSAEEAAEHPTALSLELSHASEGDEGGANASSHLVVDRAETYLSVQLPLELVCDGDLCRARYEIKWRGPSDIEQTGPVAIEWSANAAVFGVPESNPVLPTTVPRPREDYGHAKLAAEWACLRAAPTRCASRCPWDSPTPCSSRRARTDRCSSPCSSAFSSTLRSG